MKLLRYLGILGRSFLFFICLSYLFSCIIPSPAPVPPPNVWSVRVFYQNKSGDDLLDQKKDIAFKEKNLIVQTKTTVDGGLAKLLSYDYNGIKVTLNDNNLYLFTPTATNKYFFFLTIPVKSSQTQPIETYITLSATDTDTLTYEYSESPDRTFYGNQFWNYPQKIYYNGRLSLDVSQKPKEDPMISLFVTK